MYKKSRDCTITLKNKQMKKDCKQKKVKESQSSLEIDLMLIMSFKQTLEDVNKRSVDSSNF